jgi:pilus assembly protein FimV
MDLAAEVQAAAAGGRIDLAKAGADLEFELDRAAKPEPVAPSASTEPAAAEPAAPAAAPTLELDTFGLKFDGAGEPAPGSAGSALSGQWHDAATKLDLAKAYQEMGDVEGAREILQEVLREGDEAQKAEAAALVAKLG